MNSIKLLLGFCLFVLLFQGCQSAGQYDKMAEETCACLTPLSDLFKKVQTLSVEGANEELLELMTELESIADEAELCTDALSEKYGEPEDEAAATEAMRKICPDVIETMDELEAGLE